MVEGEEGGGEEGDVCGFVGGDGGEVGVERVWEAGGGEVRVGEVGEALVVEGCFEVLEGEGVVDYVDCWGGVLVAGLREGGLGEGLGHVPSLRSMSVWRLLGRWRPGKGKAMLMPIRASNVRHWEDFIVAVATVW